MNYKLKRPSDNLEIVFNNPSVLFATLSHMKPDEYVIQWPSTKKAPWYRRLSAAIYKFVNDYFDLIAAGGIFALGIMLWFIGCYFIA